MMTSSTTSSNTGASARPSLKRWLRALGLVSGLFLITAPLGQAIPGAGTLGGFEKVKVAGCPKSKLLFGIETTLEIDGDFLATSVLTGVEYRDLSNSGIGRRIQIVPDVASFAQILAGWENDASDACFDSIAISNTKVRSVDVRFSKKGFTALFKAKFKGQATGLLVDGPTSLTVKARGPWFPGADLY